MDSVMMQREKGTADLGGGGGGGGGDNDERGDYDRRMRKVVCFLLPCVLFTKITTGNTHTNFCIH